MTLCTVPATPTTALVDDPGAVVGSGLRPQLESSCRTFYEKTLQLYDRQFGVLQVIILVMVLLGGEHEEHERLRAAGRIRHPAGPRATGNVTYSA